jgi:hypothetical protein
LKGFLKQVFDRRRTWTEFLSESIIPWLLKDFLVAVSYVSYIIFIGTPTPNIFREFSLQC